MVSLSLIAEDLDDGTVQTRLRSSRPLPEEMKDCSPAEIILTEIYQLLETYYQLGPKGGIKHA